MMSGRVYLSLVLASVLPACGDGGGGTEPDTDSATGTDADNSGGSTTVAVDGTDGTATGGNDTGSTDDGETEGETDSDTGGEVDWSYSEFDERGRPMIDHLWLFTPEAVSEIQDGGQTPASFIEGRLDDLNAVLDRSLVTSSRVRSVGYHLLLEEDFARVGAWPDATNTNLGNALSWLGDYATTYGADKFMVVAGTAESGDGANWGGWVGSSYYVTFLAVTHEVGHTMGGSHCNDGADGYHFGMPLAGYDGAGTPNPPGLSGGTAMCGNSAAFYSNPDLEFSVAELEDLVTQGVMPDQDYAGELGDGTLRLGDAARANMAQTWRDNEEDAARQTLAARYPGYEDDYYEDPDCAGFYAGEGYQDFLFELCSGMEQQNDAAFSDVGSVRLGANVHVNLYSDGDFGAGSSCGGVINRLAFSSPSLNALAEHWELESLAGATQSVTVFAPTDRTAHARFDGSFDFFASGGALPYCPTLDGQTVTIMRDDVYWTGAAALLQGELEPPYVIEFDFRSSHGNDEHGDGLVVMFGKDGAAYDTTAPPRESLGFIPDGSGYGVVFNDYQNQTSIVDGSYAAVGSPAGGQDNFTDGAWVPIRIEVTADQVDAYWDGTMVVNAALPGPVATGRVGVSVGTGAYASEFSVRNFTVTPG